MSIQRPTTQSPARPNSNQPEHLKTARRRPQRGPVSAGRARRRYIGPSKGGTIEHLLDQLKQFTVDSVGTWGYLAIFVLMAAESACIPIPSEVTMPVGGLLAAEGKLDFFLVGMIGAVANLFGSWVAYAAGRFGGRQLLLKYGRYVLIKPHEVERADRWFDRYGPSAVFFSRLLPVIRTFISFPAGITKMPLGKFTVLTFVGCLPWSFGLAYAGFQLGRHWERILPYTEPVTYAIAAVVAGMTALWFARRFRRRNAEG